MSYEIHGDGARTALFTFGSFNNPGRPTPSYAFMSTILRVRGDRAKWFDAAYFLAERNDWYQGGVRGLGHDLASSAAALRAIAAGYDRVICLGNSMGGYAALAFAPLIGARNVLAFSPQTRLDAKFRKAIGDARWGEAMADIQTRHDATRAAIKLLHGKAPTGPSYDVYVGGQDRRDLAYADDLRALANMHIHVVGTSGHDLVTDLRDSGELDRLIAAAVDAD